MIQFVSRMICLVMLQNDSILRLSGQGDRIDEMLLDPIFGLFSYDLAIDLGTANTLVYVLGKGIAIREPSVVARHKKSKQVLAVGSEAKKMVGRTPSSIEAFRPLENGVISDFDATAAMLKKYILELHEVGSPTGKKLGKSGWKAQAVLGSWFKKLPRPRVIVGIPSGVTEVERRAVWEACLEAGAREAFLIEEPMAAAIGIGLPVESSHGSMIVDIGGGTTEMAVISLGGIVTNRSIRIAGDEMDSAIVRHVRLKHSLLIGTPTAEEIKITIGSCTPRETEKSTIIRGRSLETGLPKSIRLSSGEIRETLSTVTNQIVDNVRELIEETPPELVGDIMERGIHLAGGGSSLYGIEKVISERVKIPVILTDDPQTAVVRGAARVLENKRLLMKVRITGGLK